MIKGQDKGHKGQMSDREAMKLALEALNQATGMCAERTSTRRDIDEAMAALRKALEQEPWDTHDMAYRPGGLSMGHEWVGLTDDEIDYIWGVTKPDYEDMFDFPRAIEAKLREKNGF